MMPGYWQGMGLGNQSEGRGLKMSRKHVHGGCVGFQEGLLRPGDQGRCSTGCRGFSSSSRGL